MIAFTSLCAVLFALGTATDGQLVATSYGWVQTDAHGHRAVVLRDDSSAPSATAGHKGVPSTALSSDTWEPLGPFGGDVTDIDVHPSVPDLVFATISNSSSGGTEGGIFRSADGGQTWADVSNSAMGGAYDLAFGPDGSVWVGTLNSPWSSNDLGLTFVKRGLGIGANDQTFAVAVDPANAQVVYAGVASALGFNTNVFMVSTNGGGSWTSLNVGQPNGFSGTALAIDPTDSSRRTVGFGGSFGAGSAVFVSTNGGSSWVNRTAGLPSGFGPINDLAWDGGDLYVVGGQLFGGSQFGLWRSTNDGASWTELSTSWTNKATNAVAVDPVAGTILAAVAGEGVMRSDDGGASWTFGSGGTAMLSFTGVAIDLLDGTRLFAGADSLGPYVADDGLSFSQSASGISFLSVFGVAGDPTNPARMAAAFQSLNSGSVLRSEDGGQTWTQATGLPGERFNGVHYDSSGRLFALADGPTTIGVEGVWRSSDNGDTWTSLGPNLGPLFETELFGIDTAFNDPDKVVIGGSNFGVTGADAKIYVSSDGGDNWTDVYTGASNNDVQSISLDTAGASALAGVTDFAGTSQGGVLRSSDGGLNWSASSGLPAAPQVYSVDHDPFLPSRAWCTMALSDATGGLYRSDDGGASWSLAGPLVNGRYLAKSPVRDDGLVLSTFQLLDTNETRDGGATFSDWSQGLPNVGAGSRGLVNTVDTPPRVLQSSSRGVYRRVIDSLAVNGTPALGATVGIRFAGRAGYQFWLFVGLNPGVFPVGTLGSLLLSPPWVLTSPLIIPADGLIAFDTTIPNDVTLSGLAVRLQGVGLDGAQLPNKVGAFSNLELVNIP